MAGFVGHYSNKEMRVPPLNPRIAVYVFLVCFLVLNSTQLAVAQQVVFVDFDSATAGTEHVYTTFERNQILSRMEIDYARFNFSFTQAAPSSGSFSTLTINDGPSLGLADQIDFRNLDRGDNATINVNDAASTSAQFVTLTANVASHELGHILGLRHGDSFGPIGSGIDPSTVPGTEFRPTFPGQQGAIETQFHLMETDGFFVEDVINQFFSERSAIRLQFNETGDVLSETTANNNSLASAQAVVLGNMTVPNTIELGDRAGLGDFDVDAVAVLGSLGFGDSVDFYSFQGAAGDLFNFEVISSALDRIGNPIDPQITILNSSGSPVDYFGQDAFNDDEFESLDSIIVDLVLPQTGTYFIQVNAFDTADTGDYELFFNRFNGVAANPFVLGDVNRDGAVNFLDISPFIAVLSVGGFQEEADIDRNGFVNFLDISPFIALLAG